MKIYIEETEWQTLGQEMKEVSVWGWREKRTEQVAKTGKTSTDAHTQTHTHSDKRSHTRRRHPILRQTGSKMLYFPSKLKCQLILMWK